MPDIFIVPQKNTVHHSESHTSLRAVEMPQTSSRQQTYKSAVVQKKHNLNLFSTFVRDPLGVALAEQHEDEHIILFSRRAFVTNAPWFIFFLILLFFPLFFPFLFSPLHLSQSIINPFTNTVLLLFYYLVVCGYALMKFTTWFYDIDIVTEKRAVDIDFYNISFVSVATARVQDLKDVRFTQKGFLESLSDYGDVTLAVEASGEILVYEDIPHPAEVVGMLSVLIGGHKE